MILNHDAPLSLVILIQAVKENVKNVEITEREMLAVLQRVHQHGPSEDPNRVTSPLTDPSRT